MGCVRSGGLAMSDAHGHGQSMAMQAVQALVTFKACTHSELEVLMIKTMQYMSGSVYSFFATGLTLLTVVM